MTMLTDVRPVQPISSNPDASFSVDYDGPAYVWYRLWKLSDGLVEVFVEEGLATKSLHEVALRASLRLTVDFKALRVSVSISPEAPYVESLGEYEDGFAACGEVVEAWYSFMYGKLGWTSSPLPDPESTEHDIVRLTYAGKRFFETLGDDVPQCSTFLG